jgi:catechol 2,3-dioxygenase
MGRVALTVGSLDRSLNYYQNSLGLQLHRRDGDTVYLGSGHEELLVLTEEPNGRPTRGTTGLYHFAILVPSRLELGRIFNHLIRTQTAIGGFSDHAVSEAIYLTDPDGHGIEIYRDRPRSEWEYPDGRLRLVTEPFDAEGVLNELQGHDPAFNGMKPETTMGHTHIHVAHIPQAEAFYNGLLGFEVMARYGNAASFVSAGGYHHHLGMNTWAGVGAPPPNPDSWHMQWYEIITPDLDAIEARLATADLSYSQEENILYVTDPSQNNIRIVQK